MREARWKRRRSNVTVELARSQRLRRCIQPQGLEEVLLLTAMDRRTMLTALLGACVAAGAMGAAASSAMAVPRAAPPKPETGAGAAAASPEVAEGEATVHNAQFIVIRRRPRRRWILRRSYRRRRIFLY